jgi:hypothetical protein
MSNSSENTPFTHGTLAQCLDNQWHCHQPQICINNPRTQLAAGSSCQGGDHPRTNQTGTAGLNYFQALGSNNELDRMPQCIHAPPTPTKNTDQPDYTYSQWETFSAAVGTTPLDKTDNLTTRGIRGLLREQARAADPALANFHCEVRDLAQANKVKSDQDHQMVAALQSQLKKVLRSLVKLTSNVQWHDSRFDTLHKSAGAAALPEAIQQVKMLVTGQLDEISEAVAQIGCNVSGAIVQIGCKVRALQSTSGPTTHPTPCTKPTGTTKPLATGDPSDFRARYIHIYLPGNRDSHTEPFHLI